MAKFVLHGGFTRRENKQNDSFFREFVKDIPAGGIALLVFFASREKDTEEVFQELSRKFSEQAVEKLVKFVHATKADFISQLNSADAVYIHGGSTNKLLTALRAYPDLTECLKGKTVAGSSAGAYAIAKYGASHSEDAMREGMGYAPLRVICHYESPDLPPADGAVEVLRNTATEMELLSLHDCEWEVRTYAD